MIFEGLESFHLDICELKEYVMGVGPYFVVTGL